MGVVPRISSCSDGYDTSTRVSWPVNSLYELTVLFTYITKGALRGRGLHWPVPSICILLFVVKSLAYLVALSQKSRARKAMSQYLTHTAGVYFLCSLARGNSAFLSCPTTPECSFRSSLEVVWGIGIQ